MKAIHIIKSGGPEVLQLQETPMPKPGENQVIIKVKAAGVNRSDVNTPNNISTYGTGSVGTLIPSLEVSGEIVAVGTNVTDKKIGDKVCALLESGGYAEYAVAYTAHCLPIPEKISLTAAATIPETVFTVWFNVLHLGKLQPGEKILIHGGTSGIGTKGLQMFQSLINKIYTTVGSN